MRHIWLSAIFVLISNIAFPYTASAEDAQTYSGKETSDPMVYEAILRMLASTSAKNPDLARRIVHGALNIDPVPDEMGAYVTYDPGDSRYISEENAFGIADQMILEARRVAEEVETNTKNRICTDWTLKSDEQMFSDLDSIYEMSDLSHAISLDTVRASMARSERAQLDRWLFRSKDGLVVTRRNSASAMAAAGTRPYDRIFHMCSQDQGE